ncbi:MULTISPECIES: hypothetical protein [Prochlorococcus]|uniref:Uncharacterized protein n=1 Tax=Prochlorococcus marinus (strain SARG / CCMP1375 / SS120) TaxID=167539 RepID=Q7VBB8_PROMA|nr:MULTISPECIES: hypothetical protein [Prochlorococcus]AAQ00224.1 Predicted protein [Prochlorococcus marinus subsp. marinus str. CCMP1375]KGG14025.1 hypothetical protein EV04_0510 [Prochlorococcus marinus str. LG]KGG19157.1 hypothetical protein EV08_1644 [Prochlorococcus marinus str. SS2]KGG23302.1 hypothetical protein EV09_0926 [Prochlorococcus marinus str. SS35]KGG32463.1 hypothetical protein EV10_1578 [Prochlorococcus marinus str. SS51]
MAKKVEKLTGEELASYLADHRNDFDGNGDALCMAAGYGIERADGTEKCNFSDFVKALATAVDLNDNEDIEE